MSHAHAYTCTCMPLDEELDIRCLDEVTIVMSKAHYSNAYWEELGLHLGLLEPRLREIEMEGQGGRDTAQCMRLVLTDWLQQKYNVNARGVPTWNALADAMRKPGNGSNPKATEDIRST